MALAFLRLHFVFRQPKDTHYLHLAFAAPGILYPKKSPSQVNANDALHTFRVNVLGPLLLSKHFNKFLPTKRISYLAYPEQDEG